MSIILPPGFAPGRSDRHFQKAGKICMLMTSDFFLPPVFKVPDNSTFMIPISVSGLLGLDRHRNAAA